jgi:hypothetical protein
MVLDPGNIEWEAILSQTMYGLGLAFWTLLGVGVIIFCWYLFTFNIPTHIYEVVGKDQVLRFIRKTRAKVTEKDGASIMKIFGIKGDHHPPQSEHYMLGRKGKLLNLKKDGTDIAPFQMTVNPGHIIVQDHDMRMWHVLNRGEIVKKYTELSFFQKYGGYMVFVFGLLVLGWLYYIQLTFIQGNLDQTIGSVNKIAEIMKGQAP